MGACGSCQHSAVPSEVLAPLFQIRRGYRALWHNLSFTVETDSNQWTIRVHQVVGAAGHQSVVQRHRPYGTQALGYLLYWSVTTNGVSDSCTEGRPARISLPGCVPHAAQ
jgi:hypothetical protein